MNIAVISFDQDLITKLAKMLADFTVKGYTDSLSLLREISFFEPDVIIYDASGGELALNALEFFLSREQVKGKNVKVLISKENPIDQETLSQFSGLDFYDRESDIEKLVEDIKKSGKTTKEPAVQENIEQPASIESFEEAYQPPQDMEAILGETMGSNPTEELELSMDEGLEDVSELLKEMENISPEPSKKEEPPRKAAPEPQPAVAEPVQSNSGSLKITVEISPEEIQRSVIELAVEKLIEEIKNDLDIQKLKEDLQKDFFDRLEKELKESTDEIKIQIKEKLFETVEADLKEKIKESIKEDVTKITTELVKEKLDQVFGNK
ncbi:hypothetical protein SAMN06265182_0221 [Persephonella hydrogeniphila]|uniref:Uncharacterized protein n=1 Tax=Persephonella hydrogeniphila TaxID=198703 RepID=A0A285N064_9AQUI|nr:hypothetical protein [Persephonella hydrogeniphila]SNZ02829.1 hypothetical protein SAMN06265182_0221 [Persephonella hydrogeniphila]